MAEDRFEAAIRALWASLGLARPVMVGSANGTTLTIDGRILKLVPSPDEKHIVITSELGTLASDPVVEADQLRRLMRDGFSLVLTKRAALRLQPGERGAPATVVVEALAPCAAGEIAAMTGRIEDVLFLAEVHAATLDVAHRGGSRMPSLVGPDLEGSLIFRL